MVARLRELEYTSGYVEEVERYLEEVELTHAQPRGMFKIRALLVGVALIARIYLAASNFRPSLTTGRVNEVNV